MCMKNTSHTSIEKPNERNKTKEKNTKKWEESEKSETNNASPNGRGYRCECETGWIKVKNIKQKRHRSFRIKCRLFSTFFCQYVLHTCRCYIAFFFHMYTTHMYKYIYTHIYKCLLKSAQPAVFSSTTKNLCLFHDILLFFSPRQSFFFLSFEVSVRSLAHPFDSQRARCRARSFIFSYAFSTFFFFKLWLRSLLLLFCTVFPNGSNGDN